MHKAHINYLSIKRQVLLFFFQHQTFRKIFKTSLDLFKHSIKLCALGIFPVFSSKNQNSTENQSIQLFSLYFGVFSCHCETYPTDFISLSKALRCENYPIDFISLSKALRCESYPVDFISFSKALPCETCLIDFFITFKCCVVKRIHQILYHFQKLCVLKRIQYENRAKIFIFNGKRTYLM